VSSLPKASVTWKRTGPAEIRTSDLSGRRKRTLYTVTPHRPLGREHPCDRRCSSYSLFAGRRTSGAGDGGLVGLRDVLLVLARVSGEDVWRAVFHAFDMDADGFVTRDEYVAMMTQIYGGQRPSDDEVDATFHAADDDQDGRIGYDGTTAYRLFTEFTFYLLGPPNTVWGIKR